MTKAAGKHGIIQMVRVCFSGTRPGSLNQETMQIPTLASCSFDEIIDAAQPNQPLFLQLFVLSYAFPHLKSRQLAVMSIAIAK